MQLHKTTQVLPLYRTEIWATDAEVFASGANDGPVVHFVGVDFG